ncbi:receptor like protein 21 [Quercus suber]|uniref:receptor like protein 21 n=1 Tax=Quercus suber TaxID=58331 RepID=UPI0032DE9BAD
MPVAYFISRSVGIISERVGQKLCQSYCHRKSEKEKSNGVGTFLVVGSVKLLILVQFDMNGCFGCWEQEKAALLQLKSSINSTAGIDYLQTWNSTNKTSDCCDWERVKFDNTTGRTIQLDLNWIISWSREDWCLNASLFLLFEELQYLDLEGNWISRWVPNEGFERFSMLHRLEMLNLANNRFNNNILSSFRGIFSLKILDLSENKLNGPFHIPGLCELRNLREISLSNNHLEGILPSCMAN